MPVSEIAKRMIDYSKGNKHDIDHFLKVWAYARTIGECENLDQRTENILEAAAILHDIACPLCREKYGNTDGKNQEREGAVLAEEFMRESGYQQAFSDRVVWLVGHHHTLTNIDGEDYQILVEADFLVNAEESSFSREQIETAREKIFKTATGISLLDSVYLRANDA